MTTEKFRAVEPPFGGSNDDVTESVIVGVILAAGTSSRFGGTNKLLTEWKGRPLVSHAVDTLLQSVIHEVVVVVGDDAERVRTALTDFDVTVVQNNNYAAGQATSVHRGITAARNQRADAVVFALGDMPTVKTESLDVLVDAYRAGVGDALAAAYQGARGNPVLFDRCHFEALTNVTGNTGGREVFLAADGATLVETGDRGVVVDIDRPDDMARL